MTAPRTPGPDDPTSEPDATEGPDEDTDVSAGAAHDRIDTPAPPIPGGGVFSLEGRPAPGLYLLAWLLTGGGLATALIGIASTPALGPPLVIIGLTLVTIGLTLGCGYQVVARRSLRSSEAYRGPSPVLAFAVAVAFSNALGILLGVAGILDPDSTGGFLISLLVVAVGYLVVLVFLVVRTGALRWAEMGWPAGADRIGRSLRDALFGLSITVLVVLPVLIGAAILARILGVEPTGRIPQATDGAGALLVVLAVAVVAPIGEEAFFRGFALTAWQRDLGPRSALIRSTLFFALVHVANVSGVTFADAAREAVLQFAVILPLGFVLGWLFQRRGIAASIAGHMGYNATLLLLAAAAGQVVRGP